MSYNLAYPNYQLSSGSVVPVRTQAKTNAEKVTETITSLGKKVYKTENTSDIVLLTSLAALLPLGIRPKIFPIIPRFFDYLLKTTVGIGLFSLFGNIFTGHQQSYNLRKNNLEAYLQHFQQK
ncbi:hypothetical protein [Vampirovibrio chlorellavorus]|uniref:hypothetical protein n=1 Tax=Vampirovibrio chlorellavorus TaxID=758823 RepID=UPI0026EBBDEE|nr:hypothetical protein [Vampirovibrio chlorellavorus]